MNYTTSFSAKFAQDVSDGQCQAQQWCLWQITIIMQTKTLFKRLSRSNIIWKQMRQVVTSINQNLWWIIASYSKMSWSLLKKTILEKLNRKDRTSQGVLLKIIMKLISASLQLKILKRQSKKEWSYGKFHASLNLDKKTTILMMNPMKKKKMKMKKQRNQSKKLSR